jgi:hypothetical protein
LTRAATEARYAALMVVRVPALPNREITQHESRRSLIPEPSGGG